MLKKHPLIKLPVLLKPNGGKSFERFCSIVVKELYRSVV
jgi:hypothetical protein